MRLIIAYFLLLNYQLVLAQSQYITEWGKCNPSDLKMEQYELDTAAEAIILHDIGNVVVGMDPVQYTFVHHRRIKILKESGLDYADISIPYYKNNHVEHVRNVKAQVIMPTGQYTALDKSSFFTENISKNWAAVKFSFPNVKPGTIIEYEYELLSDDVSSLKDWYFQQDIPVRYSKLTTITNERLIYTYIFQGAEYLTKMPDGTYKLGEYTTANIASPVYEMQDIPAFKEEAHMTTEEDYKTKIRFQLSSILYPDNSSAYQKTYYEKPYMSTWDEIRIQLLDYEFFGQQFNKKANYKNALTTILPLALNAKTQKEKANIIYQYLAKNIEVTNIYGCYANDKLDKCFEQRKANQSALNLLLLALLRELEIEAYPVITSTRDNGKIITSYPLLDQFNYTLVQANLDGKWTLLDVDSPLRPMGYPKTIALNYKGLRIEKATQEWVDIDAPSSRDNFAIRCTIDGDKLVGSFQHKSRGYNSISERMSYRENKEGNHWQKRLSNTGSLVKINDFKVDHYENIDEDFVIEFQFEIDDWVVENDDFLYISPTIIPYIKNNPFISEKRQYPVDFNYRTTQQYAMQFTIPEGYEIEQLPENTNVELPGKGGSFRLSTTVLNDKIQFVTSLDIKRLQYQPSEYEILRNCYTAMSAAFEDMIVLKKKTK